MINVALPKGRLGETAYETLAAAGYDCPSILEKNRKLTFENLEKGVRYFWVKPSDVSIYVERGAVSYTHLDVYKRQTLARQDMERFMGTKVYLQTWVKVKENWRDNPSAIQNFGYRKE